MQTDLRGRDYISDMDFSKEEIDTVLDVAFKLKRDRALGIPHPLLRDKTLALLFFFSSTRTRSSFSRTSLSIPAMSGLSVSVSTVMGP